MENKYKNLSKKEKRQLLQQLDLDQVNLQDRLKEKQVIIEQLKKEVGKQALIDKIDTLTKEKPEIDQETKEESDKTIIIECSGGLVDDVKGLPEGYTYDIHDYDNKGICKICNEEVLEWEWQEHLEKHNPNAKKLDWTELHDFFEDVY